MRSLIITLFCVGFFVPLFGCGENKPADASATGAMTTGGQGGSNPDSASTKKRPKTPPKPK